MEDAEHYMKTRIVKSAELFAQPGAPLMEPIPVGTVVDYTGSHTHGRYVITEHRDPGEWFTATEIARMSPRLEEEYADGVAYIIWPEGVEQAFRNRERAVYRVRRKNLTPAGGDR